jgi:hypothetical protein
VSIEVIERSKAKDEIAEYKMLDELVGKWHPHLKDARIVLAWAKGWKPNVDKLVKLGRAIKCNELGQQLHGYDWVIVLNRTNWTNVDAPFTQAQRRALIDHELCHCQVKRETDGVIALGPQFKDGSRRPVFRVRHHDIEEFIEVFERHGCWKGDLERMLKIIEDNHAAPLLAGRRKKAAE